jgi:peptidoglycan/LPS O-acetylase OafA/YrhL
MDNRVSVEGPGPEVGGAKDQLGYQPALDGLRAVSVLAVLAGHMFATLGGGGHGVDVFFVLSGFLITILLLQEHAASGRISLRAFWRRRAGRLLPALTAMCPIVLAAFMISRTFAWRASTLGVATALLYVSAWIRAFDVSDLGWMGHTWSLTDEEWFYLAWPLVLIFAFRRGVRPVPFIAAAALVSVAYRIAFEHVGVSSFYLYNAPDQRACQLLVGCAAGAWLYSFGRSRAQHHRGVFFALGLAGVALTAISLGERGHYVGQTTVIALGAAALIVATVAVPDSLLSRALAWQPLVWTGQRSYGIYLWHFPLYGVILLGHNLPATAPELDAERVLALALTFAIAAASYRWLERPVRRWVRLREAREREQQSTTAPAAA